VVAFPWVALSLARQPRTVISSPIFSEPLFHPDRIKVLGLPNSNSQFVTRPDGSLAFIENRTCGFTQSTRVTTPLTTKGFDTSKSAAKE